MLSRAIFLIIAFSLTISLSAQVTIGSCQPPAAGALLDLTEGSTTTKGLGLPRVELKDLKALTMGDNVISNRGTVWADHAGLTVYSVSDGCVGNNMMYPGIYTWDGTQWTPIWYRKEEDVRKVTDDGINQVTMIYNGENETYYYAQFGAAGTWMTQNLRTKYAPDGTPLANNTATADIGIGKYNYAYPSNTSPTNSSNYNDNAIAGNNTGLLYDWYTATAGINCSTANEGQGATNEDQSKIIQGLCPQGWHLPSDREWNELEEALTENPEYYAAGTYTSAEKTWDSDWETTVGYRGIINGIAIKSATKIANSANTPSNAASNTAQAGGFDAYLAGVANNGTASHYGISSCLWSASSNDATYAWVRELHFSDPRINRPGGSRIFFYSVRCKKD